VPHFFPFLYHVLNIFLSSQVQGIVGLLTLPAQ
jgi:hypothetical protein